MPMDAAGFAKLLVVLGLIFAAVGAILLVAGQVPGLSRLGRLPGDLHWRTGNVSVSVPIVSCLLLSIILTIVLNVMLRR